VLPSKPGLAVRESTRSAQRSAEPGLFTGATNLKGEERREREDTCSSTSGTLPERFTDQIGTRKGEKKKGGPVLAARDLRLSKASRSSLPPPRPERAEAQLVLDRVPE